MALLTVQNYVDQSRALLLDTVSPYRFSDTDIVEALNMAVMEARRLRPDLFTTFFRSELPDYDTGDMEDEVPVDPMYRKAFLYYVVGHCHLRDEEDVQGARAAGFLNKFVSQLTSLQA